MSAMSILFGISRRCRPMILYTVNTISTSYGKHNNITLYMYFFTCTIRVHAHLCKRSPAHCNSIAVIDNLVLCDVCRQMAVAFYTEATCSFAESPAINTESMRPVSKWI